MHFKKVCTKLCLIFAMFSSMANCVVYAQNSVEQSDRVRQEEQYKHDALNKREEMVGRYELNDILKNHRERLPQNIFKNMDVVKNGNLDEDAEKMFEKVKPFLDEVYGKSKEEFIACAEKVTGLGNGSLSQRIKVVSSEEFAKLENNPDYLITYKGASKQEAQKLKSGVPVFDMAAWHNCVAMFTSPYYQIANRFAKIMGEQHDVNYGSIVKFAINKNAKLVRQEYMEQVFDKMCELHPEYVPFNDYSNLIKERGEIYHTLNPNFDYIAEFCKNKTGFDFFADVDKMSAEERFQKLSEAQVGLFGVEFNKNGRANLLDESLITSEQKQAREEIFALIKEHPFPAGAFRKYFDEETLLRIDKADIYLFNPVLWLKHNHGLLTKLCGFDAHVSVPENFDVAAGEKALNGQASACEPVLLNGVCDIVNFDNVVVCSDDLNLDEKLGLSSPYDLKSKEPIQTADEINRRIQPYLYSGDVDADAETMFERVKAFLEEAEKKNISEKEFDDFARTYMKQHVNSGCEKINSLGPEWFETIADDPNWLILYRGISHKPFARSARFGDVYIGGPVRGFEFPCNLAGEGSGIYLTSTFGYAKYWAKFPDFVNGNENEKYGEVVKFALPSDSKIVSIDYVGSVFKKMIEKHSDYPPIKKYIDLNKKFDDNSFMMSASFKVKADFVKERTGFDIFAEKDVNSYYNLLNKKLAEIYVPIDAAGNTLTKITPEVENKILEDAENLKKSGCIGKDDYLIDKFFYLQRNPGLLAKLMGFDVLYQFYPDVKIYPDDKGKNFNPHFDTFVVVDYSNLKVCSKPVVDDAKIRWGENIVL